MGEYSNLAKKAEEILPKFKTIVPTIPYEHKGVLYSDILFMLACLKEVDFDRILESGRARGQSTLLLATYFSEKEVISIEFDKDSPDVFIAQERLKDCKNVTLLFGDSQLLLPNMVQKGDVVIIDGPKMFTAIRLALRLLTSKKTSHVFMHDMTFGTPWRSFLNKFFPEALFSDHLEVAKITSTLDEQVNELLPPSNQIGGFTGEYGYGYALCCLPFVSGRSYKLLLFLSLIYDFLEPNLIFRFKRKFKRVFFGG